ncbi:serine/threonine-protein kinase [Streptomyces sp. NBC_00151]|uniref:serine/threonine-protein kinase n=1 Tax=Streptomyces sp. NBC_00151 TaxID=2975669 RepID=UPI002DD7A29E|nr:protein kinase [Streptomyces sp. NBC_00151]WRZ39919.1 protein kinase [Streptomyces sp. NBC_00151]
MSEAEQAGASRQDKSDRLLAGRYRLGNVLGRGGMGTVWRAEDETLGRTVAVKELRFPSAIDEDEKRRLITRTLREAKAIARIRNNGAVTVFDVVDEDNRPWIVMELIEGKSLAEAIREDGLLTPKRAAEVGLAILDVLRSAHREGILHRDVKPSNVLIDHDGRVVLTDFGIAQVEGDPSITSTGMLVGAPSYISPERARGHKPGPAADLWSLGGLLYASVEGVPPYDKGSAIATLTAVMTEPVEQPKNAGPLENVIYGLLAKDPEQRLDDAGARAMLNEVLRETESEKSLPEPPDATKVVAMPPLPEEPARLRGALRSVRKAATAAGAATAAATSAAASRAKTAGGPGSDPAEGAARTASPRTGSGSGAAAGPVGGASGATAAASPSVPVQPSGSDGKPVNSGSAGGGGAAGTRGGSGSGWPVAPERPVRPAPKASLTDVVPLRTLVILAVVVALVVVGTVLALTIGGGDDDGAKGGTGAKATASSGAAAGSGKSGDDSKGDGKDKSDASHTDSGDKSGSGSDDSADTSSGTDTDTSKNDSAGSSGDGKESGSGSASVTTYKSGQGFSIGLPKGWAYKSQDAAGARFTGPDGQKLLVGWTSTPKDDPVADWNNQERGMVRPQYKKIAIKSVSYRDWNTADWEFTYVDGGTKFHSIDRGFVVNAHQGYALMYTAKDAAWNSALRKSTWATLTETFQPKS